MARTIHLAFATASLLVAASFTTAYAVQTSDGAAPSRYVQMNSPGDGISSGAARTGNARPTHRMRRMKMRRRHR